MPPHHGFIADEDLSGKKFYDARLVKRLMAFAKPYMLLMVIAFFLLLAASLIEIYLPYLSKRAIDDFIVANHQMLVFSEKDSTDKIHYIERYGSALFYAGKDSFIIDGSILDPADMKRGMAQKIVLPKKFLPIFISDYPPSMVNEVKNILRRHGEFVIEVGSAAGDTILTHKTLKLPFSKKNKLRKPDYVIENENLAHFSQKELKILRGGQLNGLAKIALLYFILLAISFLVNFGQVYTLFTVSQKAMHDIRIKLFSHLQKLSLRFFDKNPVGRLVTRSTNDINTVAEMFTSVAVNLFKDLLMLIGIGAIMVYMNWRLSMMIFLITPLILLTAAFFRKHMREAYRWVRRALAAVNARISEDLSGIRIIQAFRQEDTAREKFSLVNKEYYDATMKMLLVNAIFRPIMSLFSNFAIALIIWYGGGQVIQQSMSLGMLVVYLSYIQMFFRPIMALSEKYNIMQAAMAASERIFGLLDTEPEIVNVENPYKPAPEDIRGKVEFRNVYFSYNEGEPVLKDVSFVVEPGKTVALVGATGAGKTTIISLLSRLYDIQSGQILIDDVDIRNWDLKTLRRNIGVVLQDVFLFSTNIRENIRLNASDISASDVEAAARIVNAEEFIKNLPKKYDEPVAERGATLSAGQRQLLSFARALAFDPKILILDEATANIDTHTERLIQDAIEKLLKGRTSIVVAHRLSTIRNADEILVMHRGKIIERGTHSQLIKMQGYYSKLYELQFKHIDENFKRNTRR